MILLGGENPDDSEVSIQEQRAVIQLPERSGSEWLIALGAFILTCLYLRIFYNYTLLVTDEGLSLQGAQRILQGQILYRDFFSFFTPGSCYWTALLFRVFGDSILTARGALMVYGGIFSSLTYLLARRVCPRWASLLVVYLSTLVGLPQRFLTLHNWDSTLWAYLALYCAVRLLEDRRASWALAAGVFTSLTCLFEQSKGAGLLFGLAIGLGSIAMIKGRICPLRRAHFWAFLAGLAAPAVVAIIYFASHQALPQMFADCLWPLRHYSATNTTPYGYIELSDTDLKSLFSGSLFVHLFYVLVLSPYFVVPALPIFAAGFLIYGWVQQNQPTEAQSASNYYIVVSGVILGLLLSTWATRRADLIHLLYEAPIFMLVLAWILGARGLWSQWLRSIGPVVVLLVFMSFTGLGFATLSGPLSAQQTIQTRHGILKGARQDEVLVELLAHVNPGMKIFVYPYQPLYYYLSATINPTRYEYLQIGELTREQFDDAIRDVEADRAPVVLFLPSFAENIPVIWPSTPLEVLAARDQGADFILSHYKPCQILTSLQTWRWVYMVRADMMCPKAGFP